MNQLVTTDWLDKNIEKVKILDAVGSVRCV